MMRAIGIKKIHTGKWISYYEISYENEEGKAKTYEIVSKKGTHRNPEELTLSNLGKDYIAVAMVAFNEDMSKLLLSKEFRMGVSQYIYNFPAGLKESNETLFEAATRELKEETGLDVIGTIYQLEPTFTCAPVTDDLVDFIIVKATGEIQDSTNINEEIHSKWYSKQEIRSLIEDKSIKFASRTQAFCYLWANSKM